MNFLKTFKTKLDSETLISLDFVKNKKTVISYVVGDLSNYRGRMDPLDERLLESGCRRGEEVFLCLNE